MLSRNSLKSKPGKWLEYVVIAFLSVQMLLAIGFILCWLGKHDYYAFVILVFIVVVALIAVFVQIRKGWKYKCAVENERLRGELLRSISHDIRTPLTAIIGACSTLIDNQDQLDKATVINLLKDISGEAQWILRIAENVLSITKINGKEDSGINIRQELLEEIVAEAIYNVKKRFPDSIIRVKIPDMPLLISVDAILIEQVLINLIENALFHAQNLTRVDLDVRLEGERIIFEVKDDGDGINIELWERKSEESILAMLAEDSLRNNAGVGLSVCKAIIKVHNGQFGAYNSVDGGAVFWFSLCAEKNNI